MTLKHVTIIHSLSACWPLDNSSNKVILVPLFRSFSLTNKQKKTRTGKAVTGPPVLAFAYTHVGSLYKQQSKRRRKQDAIAKMDLVATSANSDPKSIALINTSKRAKPTKRNRKPSPHTHHDALSGELITGKTLVPAKMRALRAISLETVPFSFPLK